MRPCGHEAGIYRLGDAEIGIGAAFMKWDVESPIFIPDAGNISGTDSNHVQKAFLLSLKMEGKKQLPFLDNCTVSDDKNQYIV